MIRILLLVCVFAYADSIFTFNSPILDSLRQLYALEQDNFIMLDSAESAESKKSSEISESKKSSEKSAESSKATKSNQNAESKKADSNKNANKPKVLIIMDDISMQSQVDMLDSLNLNITPSIMPRTKATPLTPSIAKNRQNFMLHLPLEALNYPQDELEPLNTGVDKDKIRQKLAAIKNDFPNLIYINNHTGSKFTQSKKDMQNLLEVFSEFGFRFIDSVTTINYVSPGFESSHFIMQRDVFLDNEQSISYTKKALKELISKARQKGYAIGICHPHKSTFLALRQMRKELDSSVELLIPGELNEFLESKHIKRYER